MRVDSLLIGLNARGLSARATATHGPINLGNALTNQGKHDEAIAAYREAVRLDPDSAAARINLGTLLYNAARDYPAAEAEFRAGVRLRPDDANVHFCLGSALRGQDRFAEADAAYREAIRLAPNDAGPRGNLAIVLARQGRFPEAIVASREAVRVNPNDGITRSVLGSTLFDEGKFEEGIAEFRRAVELIPGETPHAKQAAEFLRQAEQKQALLDRLPGILRGDDRPKDDVERLELSQVCYRSRRYAAAARFSSEAFQSDPKLANDLKVGHRYDAACSAALSGSGRGDDAPDDEDSRAALRRQALDWLRADLALRRTQGEEGDAGRQEAIRALRHWQQDKDLAGVRDAEALAKLPETEREDWKTLWAEVKRLLEDAARDP